MLLEWLKQLQHKSLWKLWQPEQWRWPRGKRQLCQVVLVCESSKAAIFFANFHFVLTSCASENRGSGNRSKLCVIPRPPPQVFPLFPPQWVCWTISLCFFLAGQPTQHDFSLAAYHLPVGSLLLLFLFKSSLLWGTESLQSNAKHARFLPMLGTNDCSESNKRVSI